MLNSQLLQEEIKQCNFFAKDEVDSLTWEFKLLLGMQVYVSVRQTLSNVGGTDSFSSNTQKVQVF